MYRLSVLILAFFWTISFVAAQFPFFDQMFGHQHAQQQQQTPSGASQWAANIDSVSCNRYLCPTLDCVATPHDCPCPDQEDVKCIIPDSDDGAVGTVICARGPEACQSVEKLIWRLAGQQ